MAPIELDLIHTVAAAGVVLFVGYGLRRLLPPLARYNVPAPVIGGLLVSVAMLATRSTGPAPVTFDTTLQAPLMIAFFTSIGFGASLSLLKVGGPQVLRFFAFATLFAVAQNVVGVLVALPFGVDPLLGVLAGSVTLTGGPATGLAFAPLFEAAGVAGATSLAVAAAMVGIVAGGIIGGPLATRVIERDRLRPAGARRASDTADLPENAGEAIEAHLPDPVAAPPEGEDEEGYRLLKSVVAILVAMWIGSWVSAGFTALGATLPAYIGAMLVAAAMRNLDDATGWLGLSQRTLDDIGNVALSLFIVLALMTLRLWEITALAVPLVAILTAQIVLIAVTFGLVYRAMGRDYEAAVMSGGFTGFMLGTTANAMANMRALVERYGAAPRAFLVVPMVGAFFIDFTNAVLVTALVNLLQ